MSLAAPPIRFALALGLLGACGGGDDSKGGGGPTATTSDSADVWEEPARDDPYIDPAEDPDPADFDAAEVAAIVEQALVGARGVHAGPVVAAYDEAIASVDEACPLWTSDGTTPYWVGGCTTDAGATFDGYGTQIVYESFPDGDIIWDGQAVNGVGAIETEAGHTFVAGGLAQRLAGVQSDGMFVFYSAMNEGFAYDGPAAAGTWLADGLSPELTTYALFDDATDGRALYLTGRVEVPDGPVQAVVFEQLLLIDAALGSPCPQEPSGGLSVLGEDGWYDLTFHGPQFESGDEYDASRCDGCGTAWHKGVSIGEACIDFSSMTDWSDSPWEGSATR